MVLPPPLCVCVSVSTLGFKKAIVRFGSLNTHAYTIPFPILNFLLYVHVSGLFRLCVCFAGYV